VPGHLQRRHAGGQPAGAGPRREGIAFTRDTAPFDLADTGETVRIPGLAPGQALLVLDQDGNGRVDSGAELFGNSTRCGAARCVDGLEALAQHDVTKDGIIDSRDPVSHRLRLWRDDNHDGQSQLAELQTLEQAGIRRIDLAPRLDLAWTDRRGNSATRALNFERRDGGRGAIHDVWFALTFDRLPKDPRSSGIVSTLAPSAR